MLGDPKGEQQELLCPRIERRDEETCQECELIGSYNPKAITLIRSL